MAPITCSLSTTQAANQAIEWRRLGRMARSVVVEDGRLTATFPIEAAEAVESLAASEAACCGFLSISTARSGESVRLDIVSPHQDAAPVIDALGAVIGR